MSIKNLLDIVHKVFAFIGEFLEVFGTPERSGTWIIYGAEKNGKTWAALLLAKMLSAFTKVLYISAEQGADLDFVKSVKRAGISHTDKNIHVIDGQDATLNEILEKKLGKRSKYKVVFIDNITFYKDELKGTVMQRLQRKYPDVLFIYLAHEEQNKPYGATAQMCKRLAKIIIRVQGLQAQVSGRCPGGIFNIDDTKAQLYWGVTINNKKQEHE
jgi:thymidine kinase